MPSQQRHSKDMSLVPSIPTLSLSSCKFDAAPSLLPRARSRASQLEDWENHLFLPGCVSTQNLTDSSSSSSLTTTNVTSSSPRSRDESDTDKDDDLVSLPMTRFISPKHKADDQSLLRPKPKRLCLR